MHLNPQMLVGMTIDSIHISHNCWSMTLIDMDGKDHYLSLWSDNNNLHTSAGNIPGLSLEKTNQYSETTTITDKIK